MTDHREAMPAIENVNAKIAALERRIDHLRGRLTTSTNPRAAEFDREELRALEAAVAALRFHWRAVNGETSARQVVQQLLDLIPARALPTELTLAANAILLGRT